MSVCVVKECYKMAVWEVAGKGMEGQEGIQRNFSRRKGSVLYGKQEVLWEEVVGWRFKSAWQACVEGKCSREGAQPMGRWNDCSVKRSGAPCGGKAVTRARMEVCGIVGRFVLPSLPEEKESEGMGPVL